MKKQVARNWLVAVLLVCLQALSAAAQNGQPGAASNAESTTPQAPNSVSTKHASKAAERNEPSDPSAQSPAHPATGVGEVLKMLQAGVSKEVVMTYIESAEITSRLSAADIVTLKEHSVPDDLTVALIKRGAELSARENQARTGNSAKATASGTVSLDALVAALRRGQPQPGRLDPEGYDYFRYYYLLPRSIASANQRLYSSSVFPAYPPYFPGYYSPYGFRPGPFSP
jgi:hypothetical protein